MSGVFGCYDIKGSKQDVTRDTYYGIFSLQHRGQESAGIAVNDDGTFLVHKAPGLVTDVFDEVTYQAFGVRKKKTYSLGDVIHVIVCSVDVKNPRIEFSILKNICKNGVI